mgnify:CR=1 FL=1
MGPEWLARYNWAGIALTRGGRVHTAYGCVVLSGCLSFPVVTQQAERLLLMWSLQWAHPTPLVLEKFDKHQSISSGETHQVAYTYGRRGLGW